MFPSSPAIVNAFAELSPKVRLPFTSRLPLPSADGKVKVTDWLATPPMVQLPLTMMSPIMEDMSNEPEAPVTVSAEVTVRSPDMVAIFNEPEPFTVKFPAHV